MNIWTVCVDCWYKGDGTRMDFREGRRFVVEADGLAAAIEMGRSAAESTARTDHTLIDVLWRSAAPARLPLELKHNAC